MSSRGTVDLAESLIRGRLPDRLDVGDLGDDAAALRGGPQVNVGNLTTANARLAEVIARIEELERRVLADERPRRLDARWAEYGDQLFSMFDRAEIDVLINDDDQAKRLLKLITRLAGYAACRAVG